MGDNQIGAEFSGHSLNSYTRYSVSLLTTDDGEPGLPGGKSMDAMVTLSQAWAMGSGLGPTRVGVFGYLGHRPTGFETSGGDPIPGTGSANKSFIRLGATAQVWLGNLELIPLVSHASRRRRAGARRRQADLEHGAARSPLRRDAPAHGPGALRARADVQAGRSRHPQDVGQRRRASRSASAPIRSCSAATGWRSTASSR